MTSFWAFYERQRVMFWSGLSRHLQLAFGAVFIGILIAVPLGVLLTRYPNIAKRVLAVVGILQTIPSLVLFGLFMPFLGIGVRPAMVVLVLYSILPILRNTYTGVSEVPDNYIEAATGMGMNSMQILFRVELPIALPVIIAGVQLSSVYIISWTTVASLIGAGGLGDLIYMGIYAYNYWAILLGALPASILAVVTSLVIGRIAKLATPKGMRGKGGAQ